MLAELYSLNEKDLIETKLQEIRFKLLGDSTIVPVKEEIFVQTFNWEYNSLRSQSAERNEQKEWINSEKPPQDARKDKNKKQSKVSSPKDNHSDEDSDEFNVLSISEYDHPSESDSINGTVKIKKQVKRKHQKHLTVENSPEKRRNIKRSWKCEPCDLDVRHKSAYMAHLESKHPHSEELLFVCSSCPRRFASDRRAKSHAETHLPSDVKNIHPCRYCNKKFSKVASVVLHIKAIHIGERPYICEECGKDFTTNGSLKEHQTTHSDERRFMCTQCSKGFKNLPALKNHIDTHSDTKYVCTHCGLKLNTKRTLRRHMVVHSDQKKFKCQYCSNEFKRSKTLKNHLMLHTGHRPYKCPFCEKTFATGPNCRQHKKIAHPLELHALEASGEQTWATDIPKLEQLQPKHLVVNRVIE
ncbi:zinc finger protein 501-like isoform X2 [Malaya genurostris]|nr:zinc finger protein 501-like isoform X2 [Malaya genurostris]